ncbi:hypothetical protein [Priestia abyssalis]|uniref:hypothetical protein n=1 Tax=Priestia abyssalis TaxID=1221450 RepID=UPI00099584FB|nr:hypothetical protein [Priestia abyssalis]
MKKEISENKDMLYEGRDQAYLDIDRMINEGLSGGSVHMGKDQANIEEARELRPEEPPKNSGHE